MRINEHEFGYLQATFLLLYFQRHSHFKTFLWLKPPDSRKEYKITVQA